MGSRRAGTATRTKTSPTTTPRRGRADGAAEATTEARKDGDAFRKERLATSRFGIVYDIDGPRVRLGVVWFVVAIVSSYVGVLAFAVVVGAISALAAAQTAQALRLKWRRPSLGVAAAIGGIIPLAAAFGSGLAGLVVVVASIAAVLLAGAKRPRRTDPLVDAGAVVRSAVFVGLAAAVLVMMHRFDTGAVVTLLVLASAYECGDYLIGSGASNSIEGPLSGVLALVFATGVLAVAQTYLDPPFTALGLWLFAVVAAITIPLGQVMASAILPRAGATAPALRRLDSYLVSGVAWFVLLSAGVGI